MPETLTYDEFIERYWSAAFPPLAWQERIIRDAIANRNTVVLMGRGTGRKTLSAAIARMFTGLIDA